MARLSESEINAVRQHADIVEVISHYLQVHRQGKDYKCICPFHDDHDPSMSISPDRQIFKCFVCGKGGNVFTFVQEYEKVSFPEAVVKVAQLTGYTLSVEPEIEKKSVDPHKQALYRVLDESINFTMYQMDTPNAAYIREYLDKRGLTHQIREKFQIGYNPSGNQLSTFLHAKGYKDADIVATNISKLSGNGIADVFEDRITFPIHDMNGNPIGISARTIQPNNPAKYINTAETELFTKGDIVYNYHRARFASRKEGKVYVCEGVTDVIAFAKAGIDNAVCTLGTSCTDHQIALLKRIAAKIVFCYDGDHAGQAATFRAGKMAMQAGCDIAIISNTTNLDPDEIINKQGEQALKELISHEISWIEFVLQFYLKNTNLNSFLEKKEMVQKVMIEINTLKDPMDRQYFIDKLSHLTGFTIQNQIQQELETPIKQNYSNQLSNIPDGAKKAQQLILGMMMNSNKAVKRFEEQLGYLIGEDEQVLAMMIVDDMHSSKGVTPSELIDETDSSSIKDLITTIASNSHFNDEYDDKVMDGAIRKIKRTILTHEADQYKESLMKELNDTSRDLLLNKYSNCLRELRRIIDEEDSE